MLLRKKAQSTAEYAITIGIVVAVVAGVMQVSLKGGMRKKSAEASNFLTRAGQTTPTGIDTALFGSGAPMNANASDFNTYEAESRQTTVSSVGYLDRKIQEKGGAVRSAQEQTTTSNSMTVETYDRTHEAD
jgi:mevalonate kinase